jgi:hypothetical protein
MIKLICVLLLLQLVTGCATYATKENIGINRDSRERYSNVYIKGEYLIVCYSAKESEYGQDIENAPVERWAKIELKSLDWTSVKAGFNKSPIEFIRHSGACKPEVDNNQTKIPLYFREPITSPSKTAFLVFNLPYLRLSEEDARKHDNSKTPFTAYADQYGKYLLLIRDDAHNPGYLEAVYLEPKRDMYPLLRIATYPFSVLLDVITSPVQLFFVLFSGK